MNELPPPELPETFTIMDPDYIWNDVVSWEYLDGFWFIKQLDGDIHVINLKKHSPLHVIANNKESDEQS